MDYLHPTKNVFEMRRYQQLGELAYVAERKKEAMAYIREDYARFAGLSLKRFIYYWGGAAESVGKSCRGILQEVSIRGFLGVGLLGSGTRAA